MNSFEFMPFRKEDHRRGYAIYIEVKIKFVTIFNNAWVLFDTL